MAVVTVFNVRAVINAGKMGIRLKFRAFGQSGISCISINNPVIFTNELRDNIPFTDIGRGDFYGMDISGSGVYASMKPFAEIPLVSLLT